jgi:hypothetical protein
MKYVIYIRAAVVNFYVSNVTNRERRLTVH